MRFSIVMIIFDILIFFLLLYFTNLTINFGISIKQECHSKNIIKKNNIKNDNMWNYGNYIDLGANSGDSVAWFYNIDIKNVKYTVPYPRFFFNVSKNFNTYIFEANPYLCNKIFQAVDIIKLQTKLINFNIYCPIIVSTYDGVDVMSIDDDDVYSSKYYSTNSKNKRVRRNYTLPVINITKFVSEKIPFNDFNVMKFDVEGEEHFIIPQLIKSNLLAKFDIIYSEFHIDNINNPVNENAKYNYLKFKNYTAQKNIEIYEERKISKYQIHHYNDLYKELYRCRKVFF